MLLCILEEDVGYRPSIKTVKLTIGQGQDLRLLICRESRFRWFCEIGHQGQLGQARLRLDVVYIWYAKTDELIFHWGIRIQIMLSARRNAIQSGSGFQRRGEGHWISNWEISCCVPNVGWEEEIWVRVHEWMRGRMAAISLTNSLCYSPLPGFCYFILY